MASIKVKFRPSSVKDGEGTIFYQIIHLRQVRQIYTDIHIHHEEWDDGNSSIIIHNKTETERAGYLISAKGTINDDMSKLRAIVSQLESRKSPYTAVDVATSFNSPDAVVGVVSFTRGLIEEMKKIGKRAAVKRLAATLNSLVRYTGGNEVAWTDITSTFILGYEEHLMRRRLCRNSTSYYMRNLRSILNRASEQGFETPRNPFKHVYMGIDKTVKRGVPLDTVCRIRELDLSGRPALDFARNIFMFAFYARGMSFVDMAFLKKSDVANGMITYSRRKTRQQLQVKIEPETEEVMRRLGESGSSYLLPIITDNNKNAVTQYENAYFRVNRNIQKIGKILNLPTKLTMYVARHAWASIAHSNNVALGTISKAMGHDSENTTMIYLRSLDSSSVDKANSDILRMMINKRNKRRK